MKARSILSLAAGACILAACEDTRSGPLAVSAIGAPPGLVNPNLQPLDPPRMFLIEAAAQGLVRLDAAGEIEPALAQSWIVSDDGLRYTFRIRRTEWAGGGAVTAEQVVTRLRAAASPASRNPLKPMLGMIAEIVPMTDHVLEITLHSPRPNFLQLLAQPEMGILRAGRGTGPYRADQRPDGAMQLSVTEPDDEDAEEQALPAILLRGERSALAIARFAAQETDFVTGGTVGDLPLARAAGLAESRLAFDPAAGLFGLSFGSNRGALADPAVRRALSMAVDRQALVASLNVLGLEPRNTLLPLGVEELRQPTVLDWSASPLAMRRELASRTIAALSEDEPLRLRVAMPEGPGYRVVFAHLRRDWRAIGVNVERVALDAEAELRLIDLVAPVSLASWYLRHFRCDRSRICATEADQAMDRARGAPTAEAREAALAEAERTLSGITPFIPIAAPIRWSLVSQRLTGFKPNMFARHSASELIAERP